MAFDRALLAIDRIRFSTTQGEVSLTYAGEPLGQFGDEYQIGEGGAWAGRSDDYWIGYASAVVEARPAEDDPDDDACTNPGGHSWVFSGTAYGGGDERWCGEGRAYCEFCGQDGDG